MEIKHFFGAINRTGNWRNKYATDFDALVGKTWERSAKMSEYAHT